MLEQWQYAEHYKPYESINNYFVEFSKNIAIVDNVND